jgi:hypothetical protein
MADNPSGFAGAAASIRDTGKWMLGAFAAIGTVLIAGIQFSSVAKLGFQDLVIALVLGALGLLALGWAITGLANILLPRSYTMRQLVAAGEARSRERDIRKKLDARPEMLGGYKNVSNLANELDRAIAAAATARAAWQGAPDADRDAARKNLDAADAELGYVSAVTANAGDWANYLGLRIDYASAVKYRVLPGVLVAVVTFAGVILLASSPAKSSADPSLSKIVLSAGSSMAGARLTGVDLSEAQLGGTDFSRADLTDANL